MSPFIRFILFLTIALGLGFGLSYYTLERGSRFGALTIGPWVSWPAAGTATPDPYSRAYLARSGEIELAIAEGLRFSAKTDSSGEPLRGSCSYLVEGDIPAATFWTLTALDGTGAFAATEASLKSIDSRHALRRSDGSFAIHIGARVSPDNWLPISAVENLELRLVLYDASDFAGIGSQDQPMPSILLQGCSE